MKDICVIIPTIREYQIVKEYVKNAEKHGFDKNRLYFLLITEDFCDKEDMKKVLEEAGVDGEVFNQTDRDKWFKENNLEEFSRVVPRRSHAETSFGLLWMWKHEEFKYGIFIDDDTLPIDDFDYFGMHIENLNFKGEITEVSSDKRWVNVLYQNFERHHLYPRGYPYAAMNESVVESTKKVEDVVASQGLWTNIPDLDAVRILMDGNLEGQANTRTTKDDFKGNFVVKNGNYLTVCSMNLAFKREIIPVFYQLPMDDNDWKIGRFDDIWSGVFLKRVADLKNKDIITGYPLCEHNKAKRSTFKDLNAEVPALELNEHLWQILEKIELDPTDDYLTIYEKMAKHLKDGDWTSYINGNYFNFMGEKMLEWINALKKLA